MWRYLYIFLKAETVRYAMTFIDSYRRALSAMGFSWDGKYLRLNLSKAWFPNMSAYGVRSWKIEIGLVWKKLKSWCPRSTIKLEPYIFLLRLYIYWQLCLQIMFSSLSASLLACIAIHIKKLTSKSSIQYQGYSFIHEIKTDQQMVRRRRKVSWSAAWKLLKCRRQADCNAMFIECTA